MSEIDPQEFGELKANVLQLKTDVSEMRGELKEVLAVYNQGKGAVWVGRIAAGLIGGVAGAIAAAKVFIK